MNDRTFSPSGGDGLDLRAVSTTSSGTAPNLMKGAFVVSVAGPSIFPVGQTLQ
jgi:hypothetical protein